MTPVDPAREKVERADALVRELQEPVIDDPTVFVKGAALGALTVVALADLTASRSQDAALRGLVGRVRDNQQALLKELTRIAGRKRLDVPDALIYEDERMLASPPADSGDDFDRWALRRTDIELLKAMALFGAASNMKDPELAAFAKRTLPTLEADRDTVLRQVPAE